VAAAIAAAAAAGVIIIIIIEEPILLWSSSGKTSPFDIYIYIHILPWTTNSLIFLLLLLLLFPDADNGEQYAAFTFET